MHEHWKSLPRWRQVTAGACLVVAAVGAILWAGDDQRLVAGYIDDTGYALTLSEGLDVSSTSMGRSVVNPDHQALITTVDVSVGDDTVAFRLELDAHGTPTPGAEDYGTAVTLGSGRGYLVVDDDGGDWVQVTSTAGVWTLGLVDPDSAGAEITHAWARVLDGLKIVR